MKKKGSNPEIKLKKGTDPAKAPRACHTRTHKMWAPEGQEVEYSN